MVLKILAQTQLFPVFYCALAPLPRLTLDLSLHPRNDGDVQTVGWVV
jgi:hypothetical protein